MPCYDRTNMLIPWPNAPPAYMDRSDSDTDFAPRISFLEKSSKVMELSINGTIKSINSAGNKDQRLIYVQALRFIAATCVVIFHAVGTGGHYISTAPSKMFEIFSRGYYGVDLFFVISGFIIYYSTHRSNIDSLSFLIRRAERIVPIYWFVTISITIIAAIFPSVFKDASWINLEHVTRSLLFITSFSGEMPVVYPGWSLEYEMFFYFSVAIMLLGSGISWDGLAIIFAAIVAFGEIPHNKDFGNIYNFFTNPLMLEFVFGIMAAKLFTGNKISMAALLSVIISTFIVLFSDVSSRVIVAGLPAAIIILVAATYSKKRGQPSYLENAFARLGDASYSIYLIQVFVISCSAKIFVHFVPYSIDALIVSATLLSVMAGFLMYIFVEKPLLTLCRRSRLSTRPVTLES